MNTKLTVKKLADTNFIPVKYEVIEMNVGNSANTTYCVIQVKEVGWDTEEHYIDWKKYRKTLGMQGNLGAIEVVPLSSLITFPITPS